MGNKLILLKLGKYFETTRLFASYNDAMDFVADLLRGKTQIHHKHSGYTSAKNFSLYEIEIGVNTQPKAIKRTVLSKELEKRGFIRDRWQGWK